MISQLVVRTVNNLSLIGIPVIALAHHYDLKRAVRTGCLVQVVPVWAVRKIHGLDTKGPAMNRHVEETVHNCQYCANSDKSYTCHTTPLQPVQLPDSLAKTCIGHHGTVQ